MLGAHTAAVKRSIHLLTTQPSAIVRRHPHVGVQVEALQVRLPRPARRHGSPCRARRRAAAPAPPRGGPAPPAPAPRPRRSPPARGTRPRADPPAPSRRRPAPGRGAPAAAALAGGSSPARPRPRRRSAPAPGETPARPPGRFGEHAIQHEGVKMHVDVQRAAGALHRGDPVPPQCRACAVARTRRAARACTPAAPRGSARDSTRVSRECRRR